MGSIGAAEILVVLVVALVVLGPNRLPGAARQVGRAMSEFRRVSSDLQAEVRDAFGEPPPAPPSPVYEGRTAPPPTLPPLAETTPPALDGPTPSDLGTGPADADPDADPTVDPGRRGDGA